MKLSWSKSKMTFKIGKPIGSALHLAVCLIALSLAATNAEKTPNINTTQPCVFPKFLQTDCSSSSRVCEWTLGERISLPHGAFLSQPSEFRAVLGTAQWSWSVVNTTIIVSHVESPPFLKPLSKSNLRKYQCLETFGHDNNTFVIAKIDLLENERDSDITFNCIQFIARSETVVQYKLGSWTDTKQNVSCTDKDLVLQEFPLISDRYFGLLDCPSDLRGGFEILYIYDSQRQRTCSYRQGTHGILESDCLSKEGLYIDFGRSHNCTKPDLGYHYPSELNLRCHTLPWKEGKFTYVMTSRRARWPHEYDKTDFQCLAYETITKDEFNLFLSNRPKCEKTLNHYAKSSDTFILRLRRKATQAQKPIWSNRCTFHDAFQGSWVEESTHNGIEKIKIKDGNITFPSGDSFECKERFLFKKMYSGCGYGEGREDRWPVPGRVGFFFDDYILVSHFTDGCRARITRLGLSSTVDNHVLVYRLSQSEPIVSDGRSAQEYYHHEILKRLCARTYLYKQDPYPFWGRNIEKIIHKERLPAQSIDKCSMVFNSRHDLLSTVAVSDSTSCTRNPSRIYFGCNEPAGINKTLKFVYNRACPKKDSAYVCIGKAWKFGHFILLRDTVTQRLNCVWFDKESNAILRLDSSQCSDVDWGQLPGRADKYAERFKIKYFEKCPSVPDPTVLAKVKNTGSLVCHSIWMTSLAVILNALYPVLHSYE